MTTFETVYRLLDADGNEIDIVKVAPVVTPTAPVSCGGKGPPCPGCECWFCRQTIVP